MQESRRRISTARVADLECRTNHHGQRARRRMMNRGEGGAQQRKKTGWLKQVRPLTEHNPQPNFSPDKLGICRKTPCVGGNAAHDRGFANDNWITVTPLLARRPTPDRYPR